MSRALTLGLSLAALLVLSGGCQAVLGDLDGYSLRPDDCNPLAPADKSQPKIFTACPASQPQCALQGQAFRCVASGGASPDSPCAQDSDCQGGLVCAGGTCRTWCDPSNSACPSGLDCLAASVSSASGQALGLCGTTCDPSMPCPGGLRCTVTIAGPLCDGQPGQVGVDGACSGDLDCKVRLGCDSLGSTITAVASLSQPAGVCESWCKNDKACQAPRTCQGTMVGGYGHCYAPCNPVKPTDASSGFVPCSASQRCSFVRDATDPAAGSTRCEQPLDTMDDQDLACTGEADCFPGNGCHAFHHRSTCLHYCSSAADCTNGRSCLVFPSDTRQLGTTPYGFCVTNPPCDPEFPTQPQAGLSACDSNSTCVPLDDDYASCVPWNMTAGLGMSCSENADCMGGTVCISNTGSGPTCLEVCQVAAPDCTSGTCVPFDPPRTIGGIEFGVCG